MTAAAAERVHARRPPMRTTADARDDEADLDAARQDEGHQPDRALPVERSLFVGRADDPAEADADRLARSALSRIVRPATEDPPHAAAVRRVGSAGAHTAAIGPAGGDLDSATSRLIEARRGRGRPLPAPARGRMESAFGRSFATVRVHDGPDAAATSAALSAVAFTTGNDIFFGAGAFDPDTESGQHVLAHELAHVTQQSSAARRLFGRSTDPAKARAKLAEKQHKQDRKAQQRADAKQAKANVKASKVAQQQQQRKLAADRKTGIAGRKKMSQDIYAAPSGTARAGGSADPQSRFNDLQSLFAEAIESEKAVFDGLIKRGVDEDRARDQAYAMTWLNGPYAAKLAAVRPPRETASERLRSSVTAARTDDAVRQSMDEQGELGTMLPKGVERAYEQFATEVDRLMGPPDELARPAAEAMADKNIWGAAPQKVRAQRPKRGSALDLEAASAARFRLGLRPTPGVESSPGGTLQSGLDVAGDVHDKATTVSELASIPLTVTGGKKDRAIKEAATGKQSQPTGGLEQNIPIVGPVIKATEDAVAKVSKGQKASKVNNLTKSDETRAATGIASLLGILGQLKDMTGGAMKLAQSVKKAHTARTPRNIMAATKSGADGAKTVVGMAKSAAGLAKTIDAGVTTGVASVIPGLDIAAAVFGIVSNAMTMGDKAMRVHEANTALSGARSRTPEPGAPVDVLILPMLRVAQSYTKSLEQAVWSTSVAIADLATSIANLASGGGYGIPAAVKAGVKLVDLLHSAGHFIAGEVLVSITKRVQSESRQSLEGSAEAGFHHDPAMAVDGIIIRAAGGDAVAQKFLCHYELDGTPITVDQLTSLRPQGNTVGNERLLSKIRTSVLAAMGDDADPQFFYQKWKSKAGSVLSGVRKHTTGKWQKIGQLAGDRDELQGSRSRGLQWKLKMMFKRESMLARSQRKTQVLAARRTAGAARDPDLLCVCGTATLRVDADARSQQAFLTTVQSLPDQTIVAAARDPENDDAWQEFLLEIVQQRVAAQAGAAAP